MPKPLDEQIAESIESTLILHHIHRTLFHSEWDEREWRWIVGFLIAEHGLRLREANQLAQPESRIVLGDLLRKSRADTSVDPFARHRLSDRDELIVTMGARGDLYKDIEAEIKRQFRGDTIKVPAIRAILKKHEVPPRNRKRTPKGTKGTKGTKGSAF